MGLRAVARKQTRSGGLQPMKTITFEKTIMLNGQRLPINTDAKRKLGCFVDILKRIHHQVSAMSDRYCKVHIVFFNFHLLEYQPDNDIVSDLMRVIKKQLKRYYRSELAYGWVRETGKNEIPHYHVTLMLNGNAVNNQHCFRSRIVKIFKARESYATEPHFSVGEHTVFRNESASWADAFYHLSYMAKVSTKGRKPHYTNDYSLTRLMPKPKCSKPDFIALALDAKESTDLKVPIE